MFERRSDYLLKYVDFIVSLLHQSAVNLGSVPALRDVDRDPTKTKMKR